MPNRKRTDLMVIHVTATPPSWDNGAKEIDAIHKGMGWSGIGYNEIIKRDGTPEMGRGLEAVGAHVAGFNSISYGISMVGGVDEHGKPTNNMTKAQFDTLERRLKELSKRWPNAKVCGHRDLSPDKDGDGVIEPHEYMKACPCFDAIPWAESVGLPGANIRGTWAKTTDAINPYDGPETRNAYLQRLLAKAGYQFGPVDGIVGPKTGRAITAYQLARGLPTTGEFDEATVANLRGEFEANSEPDTLNPGNLDGQTGKVPGPIIAALATLIAAIAAAFGGDAANIISMIGG